MCCLFAGCIWLLATTRDASGMDVWSDSVPDVNYFCALATIILVHG